MTFAMRNQSEGTQVLVIDPDEKACKTWRWMLPQGEFCVSTTNQIEEAQKALQKNRIDLMIVDWSLLRENETALRFVQSAPCAWLTTIETCEILEATHALKQGALDYVTKPFSEVDLCIQKLRKAAQMKQILDENRALQRQILKGSLTPYLQSQSASMQPVLARLNELLQTDDPFLLVGPNGLKLHLIAKSMYDLPPKKQGSFVAIEGELADEQAIFGPMGALKRAAKGVLLICHLDRMPITLQEKLACEIAHLKPKAGSTHPESRFRFCATSVWDLHFLTATRHISPAMLGLLQENEVKLPPLSQRREEIPQFVEYFLAQLAPYRVKHVTKDCMDALQKAPWPGQLEALEQVLTEALAHLKGSELALKDLPAAFFNAGDHSAADAKPATDPSISMAIDLNQPFRDAQLQADHAFRAAYLRGLLEREGNVSAAARAAQMDRANFRRLLKKYLQD